MKKVQLGGLVSLALLVMVGSISFYTYRVSPTPLLRMLTAVTQQLRDARFTGNQVAVLSFTRGSKVIFLGDIYGEQRHLQKRIDELRSRQLITQDLHLADRTYLILTGNLLGNAPTTGKVLSRILELTQTNPDRVFYLRGPHDEMAVLRRSPLFDRPIDQRLLTAVQDFISRLPIGCYLFTEDLAEQPVRIVPTGTETSQFTRIACSRLSDEGPLRALCSVGELCSYEEGPTTTLSQTTFGLFSVGSSLKESSLAELPGE